MERLYPKDLDLHTLSPLALAFVGDGVYSLMVRERLLSETDLHKLAVKEVRAEAQSAAIQRLLPLLTEEEEAVYKRGRNAHTARSGADYHRSTGLEALFGYLYIQGNIARVRELFALCMEQPDKEA